MSYWNLFYFILNLLWYWIFIIFLIFIYFFLILQIIIIINKFETFKIKRVENFEFQNSKALKFCKVHKNLKRSNNFCIDESLKPCFKAQDI